MQIQIEPIRKRISNQRQTLLQRQANSQPSPTAYEDQFSPAMSSTINRGGGRAFFSNPVSMNNSANISGGPNSVGTAHDETVHTHVSGENNKAPMQPATADTGKEIFKAADEDDGSLDLDQIKALLFESDKDEEGNGKEDENSYPVTAHLLSEQSDKSNRVPALPATADNEEPTALV